MPLGIARAIARSRSQCHSDIYSHSDSRSMDGGFEFRLIKITRDRKSNKGCTGLGFFMKVQCKCNENATTIDAVRNVCVYVCMYARTYVRTYVGM